MLLTGPAPPPARADISAGWDAFRRGNLDQAEAEWRRDAERGNIEGELDLGELFEQGRGDYREAERWYTKAAERGSLKARYRLALMALAGNDTVPPDPVKAYKWALLASDPNDEWGQLADNLRAQIEASLPVEEWCDGKQQAVLWRQERAPKPKPRPKPIAKPEPISSSPAATFAPPVPPARGVKEKTGPCPPGWPEGVRCVPDLLPPIPGQQAQQPPLPPRISAPDRTPQAADLDRNASEGDEDAITQAMEQMRCASLRKTLSAVGKPIIAGTVSEESDRAKLIRVSKQLDAEDRPEIKVDVVPPPLCRSLETLNNIHAASLGAETLEARMPGGSSLHEGEPIQIEVKAGCYPVYIRIDYFSLDGQVSHMLPNDQIREAKLAAGTKRVFGAGTAGEDWKAGGAPFGTEFVLVTATPQPLDLGGRPQIETAEKYVAALDKALRASRASAARPNLFTPLLVQTHAQ